MALLGVCNPTGKPAWSREASVGDYGGSDDKRASSTEGDTPYAYAVYRDLQAQRGSAYTRDTGTLVHCEHLALARTLSYTWFRHPEKARANATPGRSDERLEYWSEVLGVPRRIGEQRWQLRERCAVHYQATKGPTLANVSDALETLLGDSFVSVSATTGTDLATPPDVTVWPGVNPGPSEYSLSASTITSGGAWFSRRCTLIVAVQKQSGMSLADFENLIHVQAPQLLDRMLPIWADFQIGIVGDGFNLDVDYLDLQAMT